MYLLKRTISPYTGADLLLGVFVSRHQAESARRAYVARYRSGTKSDPWAEQTYHDVQLEEDVSVVGDLPALGDVANSRRAYVVSAYAECFGQVLREFKAVCSTHDGAQVETSRLEQQGAGESSLWCEVDGVEVGVLLGDSRDSA